MADGMPFVMTNAMKAALRQRALTDGAIAVMAPGDAHKLLTGSSGLEPSRADMIGHLAALFPAKRAPADTWIEIAWAAPADAKVNQAAKFSMTEMGKASEFAAQKNRDGFNVYVNAALRKGEPGPGGRASTGNFHTAFWTWIEFDQAEDAERIKAILEAKDLRPGIVVNTGTMPHRRAHLYFRLTGGVTSVDELKAVNSTLAALLGTDAVIDPIRLLRLAGSIAYPSPKKAERGYLVERTTLVQRDAPAYPVDKLAALGPTPPGNGNGRVSRDAPPTRSSRCSKRPGAKGSGTTPCSGRSPA